MINTDTMKLPTGDAGTPTKGEHSAQETASFQAVIADSDSGDNRVNDALFSQPSTVPTPESWSHSVGYLGFPVEETTLGNPEISDSELNVADAAPDPLSVKDTVPVLAKDSSELPKVESAILDRATNAEVPKKDAVADGHNLSTRPTPKASLSSSLMMETSENPVQTTVQPVKITPPAQHVPKGADGAIFEQPPAPDTSSQHKTREVFSPTQGHVDETGFANLARNPSGANIGEVQNNAGIVAQNGAGTRPQTLQFEKSTKSSSQDGRADKRLETSVKVPAPSNPEKTQTFAPTSVAPLAVLPSEQTLNPVIQEDVRTPNDQPNDAPKTPETAQTNTTPDIAATKVLPAVQTPEIAQNTATSPSAFPEIVPLEVQAVDGTTVTRQDTSLNRPEVLRHVAQQLVEVARQMPDRPVELALNPEELGRVRLTFSGTENGISVAVVAERGETMDLLRRHIETLAQEFRDLGYKEVKFDFSHSGAGREQSESNDDSENKPNPTNPDTAPADTMAPVQLSLDPTAGLDLRL